MCIIDKKLKLCTCKDHNGSNLDTKAVLHQPFKWTLRKSFGLKRVKEVMTKEESSKDGSFTVIHEEYVTYKVGIMILPSEQLGDLLTADNVLSELNARNCFDFEYKPEQGAILKISYDSNYFKEHYSEDVVFDSDDFMSFVFENGKWVVGRQDMNESTKELNYGKVLLKSSNWYRIKFWFSRLLSRMGSK